MPDITMCANRACPLRHNCYRYRAVPNGKWQSYAAFAPDDTGQCADRMMIFRDDRIRLTIEADEQWKESDDTH